MGEKETGTPDEAGVVKTKTKSNQSNDRMSQGGEGGAAETDLTNDPGTTWESSGKAGSISHDDDWDGHAGKLAPEKPGKSEIAIGDPGVNGNIIGEPSGIAIGEPGVNSGSRPDR
ncbi:MAG: hypothetical protein ABI577_04980 [bacterium]